MKEYRIELMEKDSTGKLHSRNIFGRLIKLDLNTEKAAVILDHDGSIMIVHHSLIRVAQLFER